MRLKGKRAIVTGGASGFGAGIIKSFVAEGARVICADINGDAATELASDLAGEYPDSVIAAQVDVADGASVQQLVDTSLKSLGGIDILVNNAGITHLPGDMESVDEAEFDRIFAVNAKSVYLFAKTIVPQFKAQNHGVILNVASTAGVSPRPRLTWYNSSKGWMITATKSMAVELASHGVRVNAINPVAGETPLLTSFMGEDTPEIRAKFLSTIPLGRFSTPQDIASATVFLCSDEASMITGVALEVDGGRCI